MPEGDTIHRAAASLRRALVGGRLARVEVPRLPPPLPSVGAEVTKVEARGKHLLIHTSDGLVLHTHQRMTGSWHLYRRGERWRRSRAAVRVVLATDDVVAVCFSSPVVEVLDRAALARHPVLRRLGPDLCDPEVDLDDAVGRIARLAAPDRSIGEVLLDQRIACGIGNVYRCEVLFLHGLAPSTPLRHVPTDQRRALLDSAGRLLRENLTNGARTTVDRAAQGTLWVYGRAGRPCRRCGSTVRRDRLGAPPRAVDHCPTCQAPAAPTDTAEGPPPPSTAAEPPAPQ